MSGLEQEVRRSKERIRAIVFMYLSYPFRHYRHSCSVTLKSQFLVVVDVQDMWEGWFKIEVIWGLEQRPTHAPTRIRFPSAVGYYWGMYRIFILLASLLLVI